MTTTNLKNSTPTMTTVVRGAAIAAADRSKVGERTTVADKTVGRKAAVRRPLAATPDESPLPAPVVANAKPVGPSTGADPNGDRSDAPTSDRDE
jgi:hypothetical protein